MKPRLLLVFLLIVLVPLAAMTWLGAALVQREQEMIGVRFRDVLGSVLNETAVGIAQVIEKWQREIVAEGAHSSLSPDRFRALCFQSSLVRQYFVLDAQGTLLYPKPSESLTESELSFLRRTQSIWENGEIPGGQVESSQSSVAGKGGGFTSSGWHAGYWEQGIRLLYWWREASGRIVGAEINEVRLTSDIVASLPLAWPGMPTGESPLANGRIELMDEQGAVLYQWGGYPADAMQSPLAETALRPPLQFWHLRYFVPVSAVTSGHTLGFTVAISISVLGIALFCAAFYFYREHTRAVRDALQRVSFVNQVSHELKTPLTNIRLYAELLESELEDLRPDTRRRLDVIVSESQRLSRMIANVLTFSRDKQGGPTIHKSHGDIDSAVQGVLAQFEETFRAKEIKASFDPGAPAIVAFDRDIFEQILGNLLSNVEKYAGRGAHVHIRSEQYAGMTSVFVYDDGPGIPSQHHQHIFDAFHRVTDQIKEGVSGVGLGLTISRQLARLHGGDLTLEPADTGATFKIALRTEGES